MPEDMFVNPVWHALETRQRRFAQFAGEACKYETDMAPFGAVGSRSEVASRQFSSLLAPGEVVYTMGAAPVAVPGLVVERTFPGLQMVFPENAEVPASGHAEPEFLKFSCEHGAEMVALTEIAFPGYFRIRTCEMGAYYGVRVGDGWFRWLASGLRLTAMWRSAECARIRSTRARAMRRR